MEVRITLSNGKEIVFEANGESPYTIKEKITNLTSDHWFECKPENNRYEKCYIKKSDVSSIEIMEY